MRILVVDDERDTAETAACVLRSFGHEVETAYDEPAAWAALRGQGWDACVIDWHLQDGGDGARLLMLMRAAGDMTPCVLTTGCGEPEASAAALAAAPLPRAAFLAKPFNPMALVRLLDDLRGGPCDDVEHRADFGGGTRPDDEGPGVGAGQ